MNRTIPLLAVALASSLGLNVLLLSRLPQPRKDPQAALAPRTDLEREILRRDVALLKDELERARATQPTSPAALPAQAKPHPMSVVPESSRAASLISEGEEQLKFWGNLRHMLRASETSSNKDEYTRTVLEYASDYLGFQEPFRSEFVEFAKRSFEDRKRAATEFEDVMKALVKDDPAFIQKNEAATQRYQASMTASRKQLESYLDISIQRHRMFAEQWDAFLIHIQVPYRTKSR